MAKTFNSGSVTLELTQVCNFSCRHCYLDKTSNRDTLNVDEWKYIIDKWYSIGWTDFTFTGGEVLNLDYFPELYEYTARKNGSTVSIQTNLSMLDNEHILLFNKYPPKDVSITLYGYDDDSVKWFTNSSTSFCKIEDNIELLKSNNIIYSLGVVLCQSNYQELLSNTFSKHETGFNTYLMPRLNGRLTPRERLSPEQIVNVEKVNAKRRKYYTGKLDANTQMSPPKPEDYSKKCQGGITRAFVDSTGQVSICGIYRKQQISNITNEIASIIEHNQSVHFSLRTKYFQSECGECHFTEICRACPAYLELEEDSSYFCETIKERVEQFS